MGERNVCQGNLKNAPPTNTLRLCRQIMNVACLVLFGFISLRMSGRLVCMIQSKTVVSGYRTLCLCLWCKTVDTLLIWHQKWCSKMADGVVPKAQ